MHDRIRNRLLDWWSAFVSRHPWAVLAVAALLVAASIYICLRPVHVGRWTVGPLRFQSNRNDLISRTLEWNRRFIAWQEGFPGTNDLFVVIDAGPEGPQRAQHAKVAEALIDDLGPTLKKDPAVEQVVWGFDTSKVSPRALRVAPLDESKPTDEFRTQLQKIRQSGPLLASASPQAFIGAIIGELKPPAPPATAPSAGSATAPTTASTQPANVTAGMDETQAAESLNGLSDILAAFRQSLSNATTQPSDLGAMIENGARGPQWSYLNSENGRLYFVRVTPKSERTELNPFEKSIAAIRDRVGKVAALHPGPDIGVTGIDVVETDETAAATWDGTWTSIIAATLITTLLVLAFHSFKTPLMVVGALLFGVAWTFGFVTLVVGHLQVISIVFTVLLLGLGIAYGIYLATRFELIRHSYSDDQAGFTAALQDSFRIMGPGIITGMLTAACAFGTTVFTDFTGVAEMGEISGVGLLLCLLAMFSVFPALLRILKPRHQDIRPMTDRFVHFYHERWIMPFVRHPGRTVLVAAALTLAAVASLALKPDYGAISGWFHGQWRAPLHVEPIAFDYNLLKLQPRGVASVEWERRIAEDGGESIWFGVSQVANMDEARKRAAEFRKKPTVGNVRGVGLLIPPDDDKKLRMIKAVRDELAPALRAGSASEHGWMGLGSVLQPSLRTELGILRFGFESELKKQDVPASLQPALDRLKTELNQLIDLMDHRPADQLAPRLARLQQEYSRWRSDVRGEIEKALDGKPLELTDLPAEVLNPYHGYKGQLSLEISPKLPDPATSPVREALDPRFLPQFIGDLRAVDPDVTGVVTQIYNSGQLIEFAYMKAGALALAVVFLLVWLDFRSVRDALLALLPVGMAFAVTFGIMRMLGSDINPANIIVLPLMFGIGVDSGVHMIYRQRMDPTGIPPGLTSGTGKGITIVNLTTLIGFGGMMAARHRGIQSLGFVLTTGMGMTLLACMTLMPAWMELRRRRGTIPHAAEGPEKH